MANSDDLTRLRAEYADRERRLAGSNLYSAFNLSNLFSLQQRQRMTIKLLKQIGIPKLDHLSILEMGCGSGGVLLEYLGMNAQPSHLYGVDLLQNRLAEAHQKLSNVPLCCADGRFLPFPRASFDIGMQYTAFSSILDDEIKNRLAQELCRVIKPGGWIIWYDFWINPINRQTKGITRKEILHLFPSCRFIFQRITLAPPLSRKVVPFSWFTALFLEKIKIFNTHYLVAIQPS